MKFENILNKNYCRELSLFENEVKNNLFIKSLFICNLF